MTHDEQDDYRVAHRLAEHPGIFRQVDRAEALRAANRDARRAARKAIV